MHIQPDKGPSRAAVGLASKKSRLADWRLVAIIAALAASLGLAILIRTFFAAPLPLLWFAILGALWLPISLWLLQRVSKAARSRQDDETEQNVQRQIELFRATRRDALTGLPTRPIFTEMLAGIIGGEREAALLVIDLDNFADINSTYGDSTGDNLLCAFADRLRTIANQRDRVGRLDGDEFALVFDKPDDLRKLDEAAAFVLARLSEPCPASGILLDMAVSIGVALAPEHGTTTETLLRAARLALRHARAAGGSTWRLCGTEDSEKLFLRTAQRAELSQAIETGQIIPWYQPIVQLPEGTIAKFEVLARWNHPKMGLLEPDHFIPWAEEMGLAGPLSMALLRQVALDLQEWPENFRFAINVSAGQLRELITFVRDQPGDWQRRMDLSRLDVEITETALMRDRKLVAELIDALHENGAQAGIDNFGSGYSNFFHLRELPFDTIKIGKTFISDMLEDPRAEACVMAMIWLGHGLGTSMIADGVETEAAADRLAKMGCHFAQGFLYARPVPAAEVMDVLRGVKPQPLPTMRPDFLLQDG